MLSQFDEIKTYCLRVEAELAETKKLAKLQAEQFEVLKKDFLFNLGLIENRDKELEICEMEIEKLQVQLAENRKLLDQDLELQHKEDLEELRLECSRSIHKLRAEMNERDRLCKSEIERKNQEICKQTHEHNREKQKMYASMDELTQTHLAAVHELNLEIDRLKLTQNAEYSNLEKSFRDEKFALTTNISKLMAEISILRQTESNANKKLQESAETIKKLEEEAIEAKWEIKDTNRMAAARIMELENCIKEGDLQSERDFKEWEAQSSALKSEWNMEKKALEWQIEQLSSKLRSSDESNTTLIKERDELKDSVMQLSLKAQLDLENKDSELLRMSTSIEEIKKTNQRNMEESNSEIRRLKEKSGLYYTRIQELQSDLHQREDDLARLQFQLKESHYQDVDIEDRITREQFVIESQYQQEMKKQAKEFEAENHDLLKENKSLLTEIKLLKSKLLQLETSKAHTVQDKEVYSDRIGELELENQELQQIVRQMRIDMENMAIDKQSVVHNTQEVSSIETNNLELLNLRRKLDTALAELQISAKEKAKLVEMSNSLRASIRKPDTTSIAVQVASSGTLPALAKLSSKELRIPLSQTLKSNEKQKVKMKVSTDQLRKSLIKSKSIRNYNDRE